MEKQNYVTQRKVILGLM